MHKKTDSQAENICKVFIENINKLITFLQETAKSCGKHLSKKVVSPVLKRINPIVARIKQAVSKVLKNVSDSRVWRTANHWGESLVEKVIDPFIDRPVLDRIESVLDRIEGAVLCNGIWRALFVKEYSATDLERMYKAACGDNNNDPLLDFLPLDSMESLTAFVQHYTDQRLQNYRLANLALALFLESQNYVIEQKFLRNMDWSISKTLREQMGHILLHDRTQILLQLIYRV